MEILYTENKSTIEDLKNHLELVSSSFVPVLSERVNINEYSLKIYTNAIRFEAWVNGCLVGLIACYANDERTKSAFITNVSVLSNMRGQGIAKQLFNHLLSSSHIRRFNSISLAVNSKNNIAISLYKSFGFFTIDGKKDELIMQLIL